MQKIERSSKGTRFNKPIVVDFNFVLLALNQAKVAE
ncbi:hypothetical protein FHS90_004448 [Rufibacter quisquiliarum]|uniref:Uncharacterized protein n=1 Tax=Rufibacter quisquiliarum TaxID=1549639 RepID=A0A839GZ42_9BACT|nr:hypothetical protein [Rufibacter quisquiliarum]